MRRATLGVTSLTASLAAILVAATAACSSSGTAARPSTTERASTTTTACAAPQPIEVFFRTEATPAQIEQVRAAAARDPELSHARFLDHQAAYQNARRLFRDHPDLLLSVKPSDLPESVRATTRAGTAVHDLVSRYARLPGVASANVTGAARTACRS